jgi:hypothetical protein
VCCHSELVSESDILQDPETSSIVVHDNFTCLKPTQIEVD